MMCNCGFDLNCSQKLIFDGKPQARLPSIGMGSYSLAPCGAYDVTCTSKDPYYSGICVHGKIPRCEELTFPPGVGKQP